jgi:hypothetical protein
VRTASFAGSEEALDHHILLAPSKEKAPPLQHPAALCNQVLDSLLRAGEKENLVHGKLHRPVVG